MSSTVSSAVAAATSSRAAPQGGILEGGDPSKYDMKNPVIIFIIQAGIIIIFCRLLHWPLSYIRQPRVIAEVIGGILLGPSVMGRIPGFSDAIFPPEAMPNLSLVANLGLILFLFLVGVEVDLRFLVKNWRVALTVGLAGMAVPFGLGCAIAWGLYNEYKGEDGTKPIAFGTFMLFIGVALAITAFPVLCRILVELKLLLSTVGVIVLSAGVGNDVVGWILLALCVALVNAGSGITALWVLLTAVGYVLFLTYAVRPVFLWILKRNHAIQDGPGQGVVALTLLIALASSFFTGVIGIHPIFGAFMAGLICPHEGGFAIKLTEKIEDLVTTIFLPLYFTLSGLSTNIGLLDSGITWGYVIAVTLIAFLGKFIPAAIAARFNGMVWRESFAIGSLMSCKGLVELIVLNIGLSAQILSVRTFTIFVVMALVTTFVTTPLTLALYPPEYQRKMEAWRRGEIDWETGKALSTTEATSEGFEKLESQKLERVLFHLRLDSMPSLLAFAALLGGSPSESPRIHPAHGEVTSEDKKEEAVAPDLPKKSIRAHGMRLIELTERESSWMQVTEVDDYTAHDPVVNTFRTAGQLYNLTISGEVAVLPEDSFAESLKSRASKINSDYIFLPWSETGSMSESPIISDHSGRSNNLVAGSYNTFVTSTLANAPCNVAVFVNNGFGGSSSRRDKSSRFGRGLSRTKSSISLLSVDENFTPAAPPLSDHSHHIFCPFFGGADDRAALRLVLQLAENPFVTATIVHFEVGDAFFEQALTSPVSKHSNAEGAATTAPTTTVTEEAPSAEQESAFFAALRNAVPSETAPRVFFETVSLSSTTTSTEQSSTTDATDAVIARVKSEVGQHPRNAGDVVILGRNAARAGLGTKSKPDDVAVTSPTSPGPLTPTASMHMSAGGPSREAASSLGVSASAIVSAGVKASLLVVQARVKSEGKGRE